MDLDTYQSEANRTDQRPGADEQALVFPLVGLASEVGSLVNQYKKRVRDGEAHALFTERAAEELGDVLWYVANLGHKLGLGLEEIAQLNLRRTHERWPMDGGHQPAALLDDGRPQGEQLPRQADIVFVDSLEDGRRICRMTYEGRQLGNDLVDMAYDPDGYRFHDAFHLTYAAVLGWSPNIRAFLERQRNSDPRTREVEDSGRAKVIEEAVAAFVFEYAREENFLVGVDHVDFSLLQTVKSLVHHLEVRVRTAHDWERAILRSFEIWRALRDNGGGTVRINLPSRSVVYVPSSD
jgi:NTP pyrophosphatase (non-canonical NTP hydrolase)